MNLKTHPTHRGSSVAVPEVRGSIRKPGLGTPSPKATVWRGRYHGVLLSVRINSVQRWSHPTHEMPLGPTALDLGHLLRRETHRKPYLVHELPGDHRHTGRFVQGG